MSEESHLLPPKEHWGSQIGVVLAVAGSAVGLGNFLRFPGTAVNNGGGAFMLPYMISFLLVGVPICWCEWTMGRLGGRYHQNSGPGVLFSLWRRAPAKGIGTLTLIIPVLVYMYYVLLEALCLKYSIAFFGGTLADVFAVAKQNGGDTVEAVVGAAAGYASDSFGMNQNGTMFGTDMVWVVLICFLVNFVIIYRGVSKGIETFCKFAMPLLIACALIILVRVLTLPNIGAGLGFMWNPQWSKLRDPEVWLRAAGQIFFSLSVGFGLILCYSSYLRSRDDVVLTSLSACSTNEFCEVILGGMIVVPAAFIFLGPGNAPAGTFSLGFFTVPAIMNYMPGGNFFGGMWFGLLFLAAVTSSLSMLQPAIAFLEGGFGLRRRSSVTLLGIITLLGAAPIMYFSKGVIALDFTDFWCEFMMIVAGLGQVIMFGWVIGAERGVREMNRGASFHVPRFMPVLIRYVTPAFLITILVLWCYYNGPDRIDRMNPAHQGERAARAVYEATVAGHLASEVLTDEEMRIKTVQLLGENGVPASFDGLPAWLRAADVDAEEQRASAEYDAKVARGVFVGIVVIFVIAFSLSDIACRNRIGRTIAAAEAQGACWEDEP